MTYDSLSDYNKEKREQPVDIFTQNVRAEYYNGTNDIQIAEDILSEGLDQPDWHLKYARNIINLILFITTSVSFTSIFFPHTRGAIDIEFKYLFITLVFSLIIDVIVYVFDYIFDQESTAVRWFNYARFWFVLLSIGGFTLFIALKILSVNMS